MSRLHLGLKSRVLHSCIPSVDNWIIIFHVQRLSNGAILWYLPFLGKAKWLIPTIDNQYIMLGCQDQLPSIFHLLDNHFIDGQMVTPNFWQTSRDFRLERPGFSGRSQERYRAITRAHYRRAGGVARCCNALDDPCDFDGSMDGHEGISGIIQCDSPCWGYHPMFHDIHNLESNVVMR